MENSTTIGSCTCGPCTRGEPCLGAQSHLREGASLQAEYTRAIKEARRLKAACGQLEYVVKGLLDALNDIQDWSGTRVGTNMDACDMVLNHRSPFAGLGHDLEVIKSGSEEGAVICNRCRGGEGDLLTPCAVRLKEQKDSAIIELTEELSELHSVHNAAVDSLRMAGLVPADTADALAKAADTLREAKGRYNSSLAYERLMVALDAYHATGRA